MSTASVSFLPPSKHHGVAFAEDSVPPSAERSKEERLEKMMQMHQTLVDSVQQQKAASIDPFAKGCQERLEKIGGWGIDFDEALKSAAPKVTQQFLLPESKSHFPVTVLDDLLPKELCQSFIHSHEQVGFAKPKSLLQSLTENLDNDCEHLKKYAYEQAKNTSELVQIESQPFADYLWELVDDHLPDQQAYVGQFTTGMYQKCGVIPVFRFMRYQPGQGFQPHYDPQRIYSKYPLEDHTTPLLSKDEPGIYQSLFTIALYLNDPAEFLGGQLNFVKLHVDTAAKKSYKSQATVSPTVGRCVLFGHDELHEGGGVETGVKYMCQCDVLYRRIGDLE